MKTPYIIRTLILGAITAAVHSAYAAYAPVASLGIGSSVIQKIEQLAQSFDGYLLSEARAHYSKDYYCSIPATVRIGQTIPEREQAFLNTRLPKVKKALEKLLGMPLADDEVPQIGIACSGGGYRAMLNTVGSLLGAEDIGLLDCACYISGVSGSTWALAPWVQSGMTVAQLQELLINQLTQNFFEIPLDVRDYTDNLLRKSLFKEPVTLVDIYGIALAGNLLKTLNADPDSIYLHAQASAIANGSYPLPIYATILDEPVAQWAEFTPFEVGSDYLGSFIPSWAFGRLFSGGRSVNFASSPREQYAPPVSLGFCMGTWGSAFAALIDPQAASKLPPTVVKFQPALEKLKTLIPALIPNWNFNMPDTNAKDQPLLTMMDGGILINFDLNSLLRRKADIIIILDASADLSQSIDLKAAAAYFKNKFALPPFNYEGIAQRPCTVFTDQNLAVPSVVYMPQIKNPDLGFDPTACIDSYCSTFHFTYTPEESKNVMELAKLNMLASKKTLIAAIKAKVLEKRNSVTAP